MHLRHAYLFGYQSDTRTESELESGGLMAGRSGKSKVKDEKADRPVQTDNRERKVDGKQWVSQDPDIDYSKVDLG